MQRYEDADGWTWERSEGGVDGRIVCDPYGARLDGPSVWQSWSEVAECNGPMELITAAPAKGAKERAIEVLTGAGVSAALANILAAYIVDGE